MIVGDKHLTPGIEYIGTKAEIEAFPSPEEGMFALATDSLSAPLGRYLGGAWRWYGNGDGGSVKFQRNLAEDLTLSTGECLVASGYLNTNGHDIIMPLDGDCEINIL